MSVKQVRINVKTLVNATKIKEEMRDGRKVLVVPSATLPDNVIMNGVRYPPEAIEAGYKSLEGTLAPLGHPEAPGGGFLPATTPRALSRNYIGAWNENVRRENGRVLMDKIIDVEIANALPGGKRVLEAINKGEPIHTSTGLLAKVRDVEGDPKASREVVSMTFDHDAILLDEPGAATPENGVGMLVNGEQVELICSELQEMADRELDYAIEGVLRAVERQSKVPIAEKIKKALLAMIGVKQEEEQPTEEPVNNEGKSMPDDDKMNPFEERMNALESKINKLTGEDVAQQLANLNARFQKMDEEAMAKQNAEKEVLEKQVVNSKLMTEADAKVASVEVLKALVNAASALKAAAPQPLPAAPILSHYLNRNSEEDLSSLFPSEG